MGIRHSKYEIIPSYKVVKILDEFNNLSNENKLIIDWIKRYFKKKSSTKLFIYFFKRDDVQIEDKYIKQKSSHVEFFFKIMFTKTGRKSKFRIHFHYS